MTRILIVEDDATARSALSALLSEEGYEVTCATNGREALELLRRGLSPSLILLDLMMPVMDGWEFRRQQARDPALAAIPFIIMSGAHEACGDLAKETVGVFAKPLDFDALLVALGRACGRG